MTRFAKRDDLASAPRRRPPRAARASRCCARLRAGSGRQTASRAAVNSGWPATPAQARREALRGRCRVCRHRSDEGVLRGSLTSAPRRRRFPRQAKRRRPRPRQRGAAASIAKIRGSTYGQCRGWPPKGLAASRRWPEQLTAVPVHAANGPARRRRCGETLV